MRQESERSSLNRSELRKVRSTPRAQTSGAVDKTPVIESLKATLSDLYILQLKTQYCHWNVEGPLFFSLHKLFEEQYEEIAEFVDRAAEMIRSLRETSPGSFDEFERLSDLEQMPANKLSANQMIEIMNQDHSNLAVQLKTRWETAEAAEEASAIVLYEDLIEFHEKSAWMIRSHKSS
ncbi:Dps family protein [Bdellovibrio reynosensis]|uniref:DNA starvation/stationary phase protection protein n=1 Tax=Bdellovibrio reynosensis TaxID=2835041 RepID=A0ABY4CCF5_9BACT|nr:DNA starvation/stationary phase protection protein [Bdellovibrio reynosensis]UOF01562.1 DNA starvation/stationary phase protection protein [Bdellovibrio reynosensis]